MKIYLLTAILVQTIAYGSDTHKNDEAKEVTCEKDSLEELNLKDTVFIKGIESRPEINGLFGTVVKKLSDSNRCGVHIYRQPTKEYQDYLEPLEFFSEQKFSLHRKNLSSTKWIKIVDKSLTKYKCYNEAIQNDMVFRVISLKKGLAGFYVKALVNNQEITFFSYDYGAWEFFG